MFILYLSLLIICLGCWIFNRRHLPDYMNYLGWLICVAITFELLYRALEERGLNANPVYHLYQLIEICLIAALYFNAMKETIIKKIIPPAMVSISVLYVYISVFAEGIYHPCNATFLLNSFLIILLSTYFFYDLYEKNPEGSVLTNSFFWINCGNLIFTCGTFFQMGLAGYVKKSNLELAEKLNIINHVLNYFLYATYLVGFICTKRQTSSSLSYQAR